MKFILCMFAIIFTLMSLVEVITGPSPLLRFINITALICWLGFLKLLVQPWVSHIYDAGLYDPMIQIVEVEMDRVSETSDSSQESKSCQEQTFDIEAAI